MSNWTRVWKGRRDREVWCVIHCDIAWYGLVWYGIAWCGVVWCCVVWHCMVWCGAVRYGIIRYSMGMEGGSGRGRQLVVRFQLIQYEGNLIVTTQKNEGNMIVEKTP